MYIEGGKIMGKDQESLIQSSDRRYLDALKAREGRVLNQEGVDGFKTDESESRVEEAKIIRTRTTGLTYTQIAERATRRDKKGLELLLREAELERFNVESMIDAKRRDLSYMEGDLKSYSECKRQIENLKSRIEGLYMDIASLEEKLKNFDKQSDITMAD